MNMEQIQTKPGNIICNQMGRIHEALLFHSIVPRQAELAMRAPTGLVWISISRFTVGDLWKYSPEDVVEGSDYTTVCWVGNLNDVDWTSGSDNVDTHTHEETSCHELTDTVGGDNSSLDAMYQSVHYLLSRSRNRKV